MRRPSTAVQVVLQKAEQGWWGELEEPSGGTAIGAIAEAVTTDDGARLILNDQAAHAYGGNKLTPVRVPRSASVIVTTQGVELKWRTRWWRRETILTLTETPLDY